MTTPNDKPPPRRESFADPDDFILDISSTPPIPTPAPSEEQSNSPSSPTRTSYLSIHFKCCNVYAQIRKTADGKAYAGHCPGCKRPIRVPIGPGGSNSRVFTAE